jgi:hypothetical protein
MPGEVGRGADDGNARLLPSGLALALIGMAWLAWASLHAANALGVALPMMLIGAGQGASLSPLTVAGIAGVEARDAGAAAGVVKHHHVRSRAGPCCRVCPVSKKVACSGGRWEGNSVFPSNPNSLGFATMPTAMHILGARVVIYPNDHRPAHVHVLKDRCEAVFKLNCPIGPPELRENFGFSKKALVQISNVLANKITVLCVKWSDIHGDY